MKAIRFDTYGPPTVLSFIEIDRPSPKAEEVLVEVKAAAVNPSDVGTVAGVFQSNTPRIPGRDFAGVVVEGGGADWNGKEIWGSGAGFGVSRDGAHAQFLTVPLNWLSEKPEGITMEAAAAVGVPCVVAWLALVDAAQIRKGETVLITGGTGSVGRAATQIAHWLGARVIAAGRGEKQTEADAYVDVKAKNLEAEVKRLTNGMGADVVLDAVGGPMFESALKASRRGGRQIAISSAGQPQVTFNLVDFYHELKSLIGVDMMKASGETVAATLDQLRKGFDQGALKPPNVRSWPLAEAVDAYHAVSRGGLEVKQILSPDG